MDRPRFTCSASVLVAELLTTQILVQTARPGRRHEHPAFAGAPFLRAGDSNLSERVMPDLLFIVSRTEPKQYFYLSMYMPTRKSVLDRAGQRRRSQAAPPTTPREPPPRHTRELQASVAW